MSKEIHYLTLSVSAWKGMKPPPYVNQFNLYLDQDEIIRCRLRIGNSTASECSKRPVLLPSKSRLSELLETTLLGASGKGTSKTVRSSLYSLQKD